MPKKLDALAQIDHFKSRLDKTISRIRGAMQGYSGFFDLVQVNEARLDRVYEQDVKTMDAVERSGRRDRKACNRHRRHPAAASPTLNDQLPKSNKRSIIDKIF